jgi:hypothetical protein
MKQRDEPLAKGWVQMVHTLLRVEDIEAPELAQSVMD